MTAMTGKGAEGFKEKFADIIVNSIMQVQNDGKLDYYGDGYSVMSSSPSSTLTAPQYYKLGWLLEKEVAIFEPLEDGPGTSGVPNSRTYTLKKINAFEEPKLQTGRK